MEGCAAELLAHRGGTGRGHGWGLAASSEKGEWGGRKRKGRGMSAGPTGGFLFFFFPEGDQREKERALLTCTKAGVWPPFRAGSRAGRRQTAPGRWRGGRLCPAWGMGCSLVGWDCPCGLRDSTDTWPRGSRQHPPGSLPVPSPREPELRGGATQEGRALALLEADGEGGVRGAADYQLSARGLQAGGETQLCVAPR